MGYYTVVDLDDSKLLKNTSVYIILGLTNKIIWLPGHQQKQIILLEWFLHLYHLIFPVSIDIFKHNLHYLSHNFQNLKFNVLYLGGFNITHHVVLFIYFQFY